MTEPKINIDNLDFRIDSEYFLKYYLSLEAKLDKININKISDFAYVTDGIHTSIIFDDNSNINLLSAKSPKNNIFDLSGNKCISKNQHIENPRTRLQKNDIIISTVGTIGNVAVVDESILPANCDRHVGIIRIKNSNYLPYYVSTILNSKYGKFQSNRYTTGNVQPNLFLDKIRLIKIPYISNYFQITITDFVKKAISLLYEAKNKYKKAEQILIDELNIKIENDNNINIKSFNNSFGNSGRLDAEYYLPKYDSLFNELYELEKNNIKIKKVVKLKDIVDIKKSIEPGSDEYTEKGIPFIRVSDISKYIINSTNIYLDRKKFNIDSLKPKKNTILLSKDGTIGIAYKVVKDMDCITSSALLHLKIKDSDILPDYLTLVLNSFIVKMQSERDAGGSILQHWRISEIENVVIPILNINIQKQVEELLQKYNVLYNQSKLLLEVAKKSVEIAIEQNEDSALKYLEEKSNEILNLNKEVI